MFSREEMGEHALKLDEADKAFQANTRPLRRCVWGHGTQRKENGPRADWWDSGPPRSMRAQESWPMRYEPPPQLVSEPGGSWLKGPSNG